MHRTQITEIHQDVAAIVTAMTDSEQPFLHETVSAILADPGIGQVVLCVEEKNTWINSTLGSLTTDPRLEVVHMPIAPLGAVRNRALSYVCLPWIAYCDGDDVWCKGKTLAQHTYANRMGCEFVGADHYLINETGKICAYAFARNIPMPSSWMIRAEIMKQYPFNETLRQAEDGEWWIRTKDQVHKVRYPKMFLKYRIRSNSLSSSTLSKQRKAKVVALAEKPLLREIILILTGCFWLLTRKREYVWLKSWGEETASTQSRKQHNS
jgi:glycosyltransferase involved in cell wall biosynthesis